MRGHFLRRQAAAAFPASPHQDGATGTRARTLHKSVRPHALSLFRLIVSFYHVPTIRHFCRYAKWTNEKRLVPRESTRFEHKRSREAPLPSGTEARIMSSLVRMMSS